MPQPKRFVDPVNVDSINERWSSLSAPAEQHRWVREYSKMTLHTQGRVDDEIIGKRRPYEPTAVRDYRVGNYRAITKSAMTQAINTLQRIFSKSSVDVQWPDVATEYLDAKNFDDTDFLGYFNKFVIRRMIEDPNGLLVWWAEYPGTDNVRAEPSPILLLSEDILHLTDDLLVFLSDETSPVMVRDGKGRFTTVNEGEVFYIITATAYYKRVQYGDKAKNLYRIEPGLRHDLGYLPYVVLGGEEVVVAQKGKLKSEVWLASYFEPATQYGDEALAQFSDWQAVMVTCAHPMREIEAIKCPSPDCNKGFVYTKVEGQEKRTTCPVCHGEKEIVPDSPYGFIRRKQKRSGFMDDPKADPVPPIRFLHADPAILEQCEKAWRQLVKDMEKSLHLLFIEEAQSGVAKEVDREDKLSTLDRMGQQIFQVLVANSLEIVLGLMRYPVEYQITLPPTFHVRSEMDLRAEVAEVSKDGVQPLYRSLALSEMMRKRYPGNPNVPKFLEVLDGYDLIWGYNPQEKAAFQASGTFSDELVQRSGLADGMLRRMAMEMGEAFARTETPTLVKELGKRLDAELAARPVIIPEPELPPNGGGKPGPGNGPTK
jgi:hypothetical protein